MLTLPLLYWLSLFAFFFDCGRVFGFQDGGGMEEDAAVKPVTSLYISNLNQEFTWVACTEAQPYYGSDTFACADMLLPLNPLDDADARTMTVRLTRYTSTNGNNMEDLDWLGMLFYICGGPGDNCRDHSLLVAPTVSKLAASGRYTIVFVDFRGNLAEKNHITCFASQSESLKYDKEEAARRGTSLNYGGLGQARVLLGHARSFATNCRAQIGGAEGTLRYVGASSAAEDVRLIRNFLWDFHLPDQNLRQEIRKDLNLWGFSWGSLVVDVLLSSHPNEVKLTVLESPIEVTTPEDHTAAYSSKIVEVDEAIRSLVYYCTTGKDNCGLRYSPFTNAPLTTHEALATLSFVLQQTQALFEAGIPRMPSYLDLARGIYSSIYNPFTVRLGSIFESVPAYLRIIHSYHFQIQHNLLPDNSITTPPDRSEQQEQVGPNTLTHAATEDEPIEYTNNVNPSGRSQAKLQLTHERFVLICPDILSYGSASATADSILATYQAAQAVSAIGAEGQLDPWLYCLFLQDSHDKSAVPVPTNALHLAPQRPTTPTARPLIIANSLDPVAPARNMEGVLRYNSWYTNHHFLEARTTHHGIVRHMIHDESGCLWKVVHDYLTTGNLPEGSHTICDVKVLPFSAPNAYPPERPAHLQAIQQAALKEQQRQERARQQEATRKAFLESLLARLQLADREEQERRVRDLQNHDAWDAFLLNREI
ncbi:hypothetical protein BJ508DRAFT_344438 [Ascobolus immersus RN42]|uniref:Uncharacterized protein n=1 Tax=Ascobolus immersus RN42 TaxID=1160509 RepID=A0A3N4HAE2_ASCIM|nr:hypothetical protein BJ508DRAFT_344438 [Ascobolus immersus RN42]